LKKLKNVEMTLDLLKETKAGRVVHKLEKTSGLIGSEAKEIVQTWKALLPEEPTSPCPPEKGNRDGHDSDVERVQVKRRKVESSSEPTFLTAENQHFSSAGHARVQRRLAQCSPGVTMAASSRIPPPKSGPSPSHGGSSQQRSLSPLPDLPPKLDPTSLDIDDVSMSHYSAFYTSEDDHKKTKSTQLNTTPVNIAPKKKRTQVYSGKSTAGPTGVRKLFTLCIDVLIEHIDVIEEVGAIPFDVLRPVLEKCSAQQLKRLEFYNQHFIEDDDELWQKICRKDFREALPRKGQSWRDLYMEKDQERESRLQHLSASIKSKMVATQEPVRKAQVVGYVHRDPSRRRRGGWGGSKSASVPSRGSSLNNSMMNKPVYKTKLMKQTEKMAKERAMMTGRRR
jgi:hypothetical protein